MKIRLKVCYMGLLKLAAFFIVCFIGGALLGSAIIQWFKWVLIP